MKVFSFFQLQQKSFLKSISGSKCKLLCRKPPLSTISSSRVRLATVSSAQVWQSTTFRPCSTKRARISPTTIRLHRKPRLQQKRRCRHLSICRAISSQTCVTGRQKSRVANGLVRTVTNPCTARRLSPTWPRKAHWAITPTSASLSTAQPNGSYLRRRHSSTTTGSRVSRSGTRWAV